jgi:hypothetical protein
MRPRERAVFGLSLALCLSSMSCQAQEGRTTVNADQPGARPQPAITTFEGLPVLGLLRLKKSAEIDSSRLSVGFEALDRRLFEPEKTYAYLADLGVKWARVQTGWCRSETEKGRYDFAWLDEVVDQLRRIGIQPWFNVGYGNKLYTPESTHEFAVGWAPTNSDEARAAWLAYVGALVEHFKGRVAHFEIWNEPNLKFYWQPNGPDPKQYTDFVRLTAAEIRLRHPKAVIIGGGLSGGLLPGGLAFAEKCLEAGLAESIDGFSVHAYERVPETAATAENVARLRAMLDRCKPGLVIWQGEGGSPSRSDGFGSMSNLNWNEERQAKYLLRRVVHDFAADLAMVSYFTTCDLKSYVGRGVTEKFAYFGLLRGEEYTPKPSYNAYRCLNTLLSGHTRPTDEWPVAVRRTPEHGTAPEEIPPIRQAVFIRDRALVLAWWSPATLVEDKADGLMRPYEPATVDLDLPRQSSHKLSDPVLVDPMTQLVYDLRSRCIAEEGGQRLVAIRGLPLLDYPLFVTGRADVEIVPSNP